MRNRCRLVADGTMGTILENHGNGWLTIKFDGAPTCQDIWAPLTRGLIILEADDAREAS